MPLYYDTPKLDLASIMLSAAEMRRHRAELGAFEDQRREASRQQQASRLASLIPEAIGYSQQGHPEMLQQIQQESPEALELYRQRVTAQRAAQQESDLKDAQIAKAKVEAAQPETNRIASVRRFAEQGIKSGADPMQMAALLRQFGADQGLRLPEQPEWHGNGPQGQQIITQDLLAQLAGGSAALGEPKQEPMTTDMREYASISGLQPGDPAWGPDFSAWSQQQKKNRATQVNVGQGELTTARETEVQSKVDALRETAFSLEDIKANMDPQFLRFAGKTEAEARALYEKLGSPLGPMSAEGKGFLRRSTMFNQKIERLFNSYRKLITGAGASTAELDRLQKSYLSGGLSETEFEASLDQLHADTMRDLNINASLLRQGENLKNPLDVGAQRRQFQTPEEAARAAAGGR